MEQEQIDALVRTGRALVGEVKTLTEQIEAIQAKLKKAIPVGDKVVVDGVPVTHKNANRSFNPKLALAQMTPEERETCVKLAVDSKEVRKVADTKGITDSCMEAPKADAKTSILLIPS